MHAIAGRSDRESAHESTQKETKQDNIPTRRTSPSPTKKRTTTAVSSHQHHQDGTEQMVPVSKGGKKCEEPQDLLERHACAWKHTTIIPRNAKTVDTVAVVIR